MRIDSQIGFARSGFFAGAAEHMQRSFEPDDLHRILERNRFEGGVAFAMGSDPGETDWLLAITRDHPWVRGIVGNETNPRWLDRWQQDPRFKGVRCGPGADFRELASRDLTCDFTGTAVLAAQALEEAPGLRLVVSHRECAGLDRAMVKVSLLQREPLPPVPPDRLLFASDWPHCMHTGIWKETLAAFTQSIGAQSMETRELLLGGNANRFYRLGVSEDSGL